MEAGGRRIVSTPGGALAIGPAEQSDLDELFACFSEVVASGEGWPQSPPLTRPVFLRTWVEESSLVVAARHAGAFVGAYYLKPNFPGRAAHVANAGYVVARAVRGRGFGEALVLDSIARAPLVGFDAVMFNLVFSSNPARAMYERLGWREIGRIPDAVDGEAAVIYWRGVGPARGPGPGGS